MRALGLVAAAIATAAAVHTLAPGAIAQDVEVEGELIQIGPDAGAEPARRDARRDRRATRPGLADDAPVAVSRYWIGIGGGPLPPALRAQVDVPSDQGVLVQTVAGGGPADEAGIQRFDIILRANGDPVGEMSQLAELVGEQGELQGRITLDLLRRGQPKTLWVAPVERPVDAVIPAPRERRGLGLLNPERGAERGRLFGDEGFFGGEGLQGLEGLLGPDGLQLGEEGLGGLGEMMPQIAGAGVSVRVQRQADGPGRVTVQSGGQSWEFDEGDQEAIAALPENVRPMVERMLGGRGGAIGQDFEGFGFGGPGFQLQFGGGPIAGRLRELQEQMQGFGAAPAAPPQGFGGVEPNLELDEAPAFNAAPADDEPAELPAPADDAGPIEIEIPAE